MASLFHEQSSIQKPYPERDDIFLIEVPNRIENVVVHTINFVRTSSASPELNEHEVTVSMASSFLVVDSMAQTYIRLSEEEIPIWRINAQYGLERPYPDACNYSFELEF